MKYPYLIVALTFVCSPLFAQRTSIETFKNWDISSYSNRLVRDNLTRAKAVFANSNDYSSEMYSEGIRFLEAAKTPSSGARPNLDAINNYIIFLQNRLVALATEKEAEAKSKAEEAEVLRKLAEENALQAALERDTAQLFAEKADSAKAVAIQYGKKSEAGQLVSISSDARANKKFTEALTSAYMAIQLSGSDSASVNMWRQLAESALPLKSETRFSGTDTIVEILSPPSRELLLARLKNQSIIALDLKEGEPKRTIKAAGTQPALLRIDDAGEQFAYTNDNNEVVILNLSNFQEKARIEHDERIYDILFSQNGNYLASASADQTASLIDLQQNKPKALRLSAHTGKVYELAFNEAANLLLTRGADQQIHVWNLNGQNLGQLKGHAFYIDKVLFSESGNSILTVGALGDIKVWEASTRNPLHSIQMDSTALDQIFFLNDDRYVLTKDVRNNSKLLNLKDTRSIRPEKNQVASLDRLMNSDQPVLSYTNGGFQTINEEGQENLEHTGHNAPLKALDYLEEEANYLSSGQDGTVKLWNRDGRVLCNIAVDEQNPLPAFFSADRTGFYYFPKGNNILQYIDLPRLIYQTLATPEEGTIAPKIIEQIIQENQLYFYKENRANQE